MNAVLFTDLVVINTRLRQNTYCSFGFQCWLGQFGQRDMFQKIHPCLIMNNPHIYDPMI